MEWDSHIEKSQHLETPEKVEIPSDVPEAESPERASLAELRQMGLDEYRRRCSEVVLRIVQLAQRLEDPTFGFSIRHGQGESDDLVKETYESLNRFRLGEFQSLDALVVDNELDPSYPVRLFGLPQQTVTSETQGAGEVTGEKITEVAVGHPIAWTVWLSLYAKLEPADQHFVDLAWRKTRLERSIFRYNEEKDRLERHGVDIADPRIFSERNSMDEGSS